MDLRDFTALCDATETIGYCTLCSLALQAGAVILQVIGLAVTVLYFARKDVSK